MKPTYQPTTISNNSFYFCRITVAILLWLALILNIKWLTIITFLIFTFSAILGVNKAPLVIFYSYTLGKIFPHPKKVTLDIKSIRFAHIIAASFNLIIIILYYTNKANSANIILLILTILKTISIFGYCPASKLRSCILSKGECCSFSKKIKRNNQC